MNLKGKFYSLKMKFIILLVSFVGSFVAIIFMHLFTSGNLKFELNQVEALDFPQFVAASNLEQHFNELTRSFEDAVLVGENVLLERAQEEKEIFDKSLIQLVEISPSSERFEFEILRELFMRYFENASKLAELLIENKASDLSGLSSANISEKSEIVSSLKEKISVAIRDINARAREKISNSFGRFKYNVNVQVLRFLVIGVFSTIFISIFLIYLTKKIVSPIRILSKMTSEVARGNLNYDIKFKNLSNDEVGKLANSFEKMRVGLKETTVSKDYVDNIIQSMADALIVLDNEFKIVTVNDATLRRLQFSEQELLQNSMDVIVHGKDFIKWCGEQNLFKKGLVSEKEKYLVTKSGKEIPVLFSASVLKDSKGENQGMVCLAQDITALKEAEAELAKRAEELSRSNEDLEQFAYVASHDLQEPLRMVTSYLQLLKKRYQGKLGEDAEEFIHYAVDGAVRMKGLINDLLAFSRVGRGKDDLVEVNLNDVMSEVKSLLASSLEEKKGTLVYSTLPNLLSDKRMMIQLFQNIVSNGLKYCDKENPRVEILARSKEDWVTITIKDNGIGMEQKYLEKIFVIFQRLHTKQEYPGTGIGLAICKKIVERHGGKIWVESELGGGSAFHFELPLYNSENKKEGENA